MCDAVTATLAFSALSTGASMVGSYKEAQASKAQGEYQARVAENNAIIANNNAALAEKQGEIEKKQQRLATAQLIGKQRAGYAASGVLVDTGSALTTTADTAALGNYEEQVIDYDTQMESYNYRNQASSLLSEAELKRLKGDSDYSSGIYTAGGSLLSGGSSFADKWNTYKK